MRTKQEILKEKGIYIGFKSTYDMDSIFKAMQEYAEEYHRTELLKLKAKIFCNICIIICQTPK